ncbi:alginate export family protein [Aliikangiella sp. IMCC44359]|uniref:alginate export family protein n=1 Tax=Aliikangiella sp. IMCC44359 TaxID=3459125 RepID=UPI00403AEA39
MSNQFKKNLVTACVLAATSTGIYASDNTDISSTIDLSFRYRIELVDQENIVEEANASTMRTRATIKTQWNSKFDSVLEFDDVTEIGMNDFNAGQGNTPDRGQFPVVADPEGTEVNQAFIRYNGDIAKFGYGRQRILVGNQRFIGGVGWRQNEQTYDSFTIKSKPTDKLSLNYAYVFNVNRIFGEAVNAGDHKHNTHLINADYQLDLGQLSAYYFSVDNEDAFALSNNTLGIRFAGKAGDFAYTLEYASQSETGDNPNNYSADYYLLSGAYQQDNFSIGAGYEVLGGDTSGGQGFTTSLATLHKFQGWADVFLGTPVSGIEDLYIDGTYKVNGFNFKVVYHNFSTDENGSDLGTEIDFSVAKKINKNLSVLFKYADFSSDNVLYSSREKTWLMLTYKL